MSFVSPREVFEQGWLTVSSLEKPFDPDVQIQQAGIDLRAERFYRLVPRGQIVPDFAQVPSDTEVAFIGEIEKELPSYQLLDLESAHFSCLRDDKRCYKFAPGAYTVDFLEHVEVPEHCMALIIHRSTLNRSGTIVTGSVFDPGFSGQLGCTMYVHETIVIEPFARLAQIVFLTGEAANQYTGSYKDKTHAELSGVKID